MTLDIMTPVHKLLRMISSDDDSSMDPEVALKITWLGSFYNLFSNLVLVIRTQKKARKPIKLFYASILRIVDMVLIG